MEILGLLVLAVIVALLVRVAAKTQTDGKSASRAVEPTEETLVRLRRPESDPPPRSPEPPKPAPAVAEPRRITGRAYVVDGDTITIKGVRLRLYGVDAPEMDHPYGKVAKSAMIRLCKGQDVTAEIREEDTHGRTVALCRLSDGRDLSAELVKMGLALDWAKFSGGAYRPLETADARRKLWLADARQKGRMDVWERFEAKRKARVQVD